jgi:CrcB protein
MTYLLVAIGSALGGMARHWCGMAAAARWGTAFPWGTILINIVGSFLIGVVAAFTEPDGRWGPVQPARDFLMVGVLGGYTTFSAFSLQTLTLLRDGKLAYAAGNVALSVGACVIAVWLGYVLGAAFRRTA